MAGIPGRKAIVLMTDGVDQSSIKTFKSTVSDIAEQDVLIYTVQYNTLPQLPERLSQIKSEKARRKVQERLMKGYALSEPYLRTLAEKTGGRFYRADDLRDVVRPSPRLRLNWECNTAWATIRKRIRAPPPSARSKFACVILIWLCGLATATRPRRQSRDGTTGTNCHRDTEKQKGVNVSPSLASM